MPILDGPRWSYRDTFYFALIGIGELLIFFNNPGHFFMGDTLFWMGHRYRSVAEFLRGFITLDPALWYRPLAQRTVESLMYPVAGLHPLPYRAVTFCLFFACTVAVFVVTEKLTESRRASWFATLFFAPHVVNAFVTYDTAFIPEMVFTLFYAGAVIAYVAYLRTGSRNARIASVVLFAGSLMSKETAVALPLTLLAVALLLLGKKNARSIRSLAPHFLVLGIYLVFTVGFLHIRAIDVREMMAKPDLHTLNGSGYQLVLGKNLVSTTRVALSWAFNLPRDYGQWEPSRPRMLVALKICRLLIGAAALLVLFTPRRKFLLIGLAWFFTAALPTLPLTNHFLPYYLFAPIVGFSIAIGTVMDWAYAYCARMFPSVTFALCAAWITVNVAIDADMAIGVPARHYMLEGSAESAWNGLDDLRALHPLIPSGTTLLIFNEENSATSWNQAKGLLFQMAYGDDSIQSQYADDGITFPGSELENGKVIALKLARGHFSDITSFVKQRPELLLPHIPDEHYSLELSRPVVHGDESVVMTVPELKDVTLNVLRAYNGKVEDPFQVKLDSHGQAEFKIGNETKAGDYTFVALQRSGEPNWVTVSGTVKVDRP